MQMEQVAWWVSSRSHYVLSLNGCRCQIFIRRCLRNTTLRVVFRNRSGHSTSSSKPRSPSQHVEGCMHSKETVGSLACNRVKLHLAVKLTQQHLWKRIAITSHLTNGFVTVIWMLNGWRWGSYIPSENIIWIGYIRCRSPFPTALMNV